MERMVAESERRLAELEQRLSSGRQVVEGEQGGPATAGSLHKQHDLDGLCREAQALGNELLFLLDPSERIQFEKEMQRLELGGQRDGADRARKPAKKKVSNKPGSSTVMVECGPMRSLQTEGIRQRVACVGCGQMLLGDSPLPGETPHSTGSLSCVFQCGRRFCSKNCRHRSARGHREQCPGQRRKALQKQISQASDQW